MKVFYTLDKGYDMLDHIMEWFYTDVTGIRSDDVFMTVEIHPRCTEIIDSFKCCFRCIRGDIRISYSGGELNIELLSNVSIK